MAFTIIREDLARVVADAIVVPSNTRLSPDGGVALAVAKAAGYRRVKRACNRLGGCPVGQAAATPAFKLPARHIIHAVGPMWRGGASGEAKQLHSAYESALDLALRLNAQSVALPLLSAGTYGYPVREAFEVAMAAIREFLETADIDVMLVLFDKQAVLEGSRAVGEIAEYIDDAYAAAHVEGRAPRDYTQVVQDGSLYAGWGIAADSAPFPEEDTATDLEALAAPGPPAWPQAAAAAPAPAPAPAAAKPSAPTLLAQPTARKEEAKSGWAHPAPAAAAAPDLGALLAQMDEPFSAMLLRLIDARGLTDAQVYKRANITRQHFSKMRKPGYKPTKKTVVALAIALELSLEETRELLARAGFALSHSSKFDIIVEYFIAHGQYDIFAVNEALFAYDQPLLA